LFLRVLARPTSVKPVLFPLALSTSSETNSLISYAGNGIGCHDIRAYLASQVGAKCTFSKRIHLADLHIGRASCLAEQIYDFKYSIPQFFISTTPLRRLRHSLVECFNQSLLAGRRLLHIQTQARRGRSDSSHLQLQESQPSEIFADCFGNRLRAHDLQPTCQIEAETTGVFLTRDSGIQTTLSIYTRSTA